MSSVNHWKSVKYKDLRVGDILAFDHNYDPHRIFMVTKLDWHSHKPSTVEVRYANMPGNMPIELEENYFNSLNIESLEEGASIPSPKSGPTDMSILQGADLDRFAAERFGVLRTPGYPDADFRNDLIAYLRGHNRGAPAKPKVCSHVWHCDYQSMFNSSMDKYSCKICGMKKENV